MIGKVIDTSGIVDIATRGSTYVGAHLYVAVRERLSLVVPAAALAAASSLISVAQRDDLTALLTLRTVSIPDLRGDHAAAVGLLTAQGRVDSGHVIWWARETGFPVLTRESTWLRSLDGTIELDQIP